MSRPWTYLALTALLTAWAGAALSQQAPPAEGSREIIVVPEDPEDAPPPGTNGPARPARPADQAEPPQFGGDDEGAPALGAPAMPSDSNALRTQGPGPAAREEGPFVPGKPAIPQNSLVDEAPSVPVTRAENARPEKAYNPLPHEGKQTVRRRARLDRNTASGWSMLNFENEPGLEKLPVGWILPCRLLERMEQLSAGDGKVVFEVSCDNTIYEGRCFVMLRNVRIARPPADPLPEALRSTPAAPAGPVERTPATAPATQAGAATTKPASTPFTGPSSAEVLQVLLKDRRGAPVIVEDRKATAGENPMVAAPTKAEPSVAVLEHANKMVVNRRAQLIATGNGAWKEIRFYDDNNLQLPPLTVLPSAMLKKAEANQDSDLAVTGEITVYRGRQFLMLHSVEPVLPLGRF